MANFTNQTIQSTYQRVLQLDTGSIQDGLGNEIDIPIRQLSGSALISGSTQIGSDISGSFTAVSSSFSTRVTSLESFSSSLDNTYATDADVTAVSTRVTGIENLTGSFATTSSISGSFNVVSSSLAARITAATSSIGVNQDNLRNITVLTGSYARTNVVNQFATGQKISGSLIVSGANSTFLGSIDVFTPSTAPTYAAQTIYINSNDGANQVYSGLQIVDQGGADAKVEINSYTGKDGTNPVFRLLGGGSGSKSDNTILSAFNNGDVFLERGLVAKDSVTISGSLQVTSSFGNNITFIGTLQQGTPTKTLSTNTVSLYTDSNYGSSNIYSSLQVVDQRGDDAKLEVNSYTSLDGSNPVFRLMGGGNIGDDDNTILRAFCSRSVEIVKDYKSLGTHETVGATKLTPAFFSGSAGVSYLLTGSSYDNVSLVKLDFTGSVNGTATCLLPDATLDQHTYRSIRFFTSASVDNQKIFKVKPSGSQLLDGDNAGQDLNRSYEGIMVWSDGTEWYKIQAKNV